MRIQPEFCFSLANLIALMGWLSLILLGRFRYVPNVLVKLILPALLAGIYAVALLPHWAGHSGSFNSLQGIALLFEDRWLLTAGWVHYLAFDLFLGAWQTREAHRLGIAHWQVVPSLLATYFFGPIGFLLFLLLRATLRSTR